MCDWVHVSSAILTHELSALYSPPLSAQPNLLTRAVHLFRKRPGLHLAVAALPYATLYPALWCLSLQFFQLGDGPRPDLRHICLNMSSPGKTGFLTVFFLWIVLPYAVAGRGLCRLAANQMENRPSTFAAIAVEMAAFLPSALLLTVIVSCVCLLGTLFLVAQGFFAGAAFSLVVPASAIERLGPFGALRRVLSVMTGAYGRLLLLFSLSASWS